MNKSHFLKGGVYMANFVNLHLHTVVSLQDSVIRVTDLIKKVREFGQSAVAVTDHSSVASWVDLSRECKDINIKAIFGNEFYCSKTYEEKSRDRDHLVLLAMNHDGLVNIRRFQRIAVENFYYRPILSYQTIKDSPHDGIYCTSACALGVIAKNITNNNIQGAIDYAEKFNSLFNGNFALELQFHPDFKEQAIINEKLVEISDKLNIPLTVSCDSHFIDEGDRDLRRIVQAISWHKKYEDVEESLKSNCIGNSELIKKFAIESGFPYMDVVPSAIKQTNKIASMCNAKLETPERRIPVFDKHDELDNLFEVIE
jgi:DNA polymerase-3 subunit alpha